MHHRWSLVRIVTLALLALGALGAPRPAEASHFRYGHLTWKRTGTGNNFTVEFTFTAAFRRGGDPISGIPGYPGTAPDGYLAVGDVFDETIGGTILFTGDGSAVTGINGGPLTFLCVAIDPVRNYVVARAIDPRTGKDRIAYRYLAPRAGPNTPWVAELFSCCRVSGLRNRFSFPSGSTGYRVLTTIDMTVNGGSAVSSLPPIRPVSRTGSSFIVPAIDPDENRLAFRLAGVDNFGIEWTGEFQPDPDFGQPPGVTVDPVTGEYTVPPDLRDGSWATQVVIEEYNEDDDLVGQSAVDFMFQVGPAPTGNMPQFDYGPTPPDNAELIFIVGRNRFFTVQASDPDGDLVTLNTTGVPIGAEQGPALPWQGRPVVSTFSWTPNETDIGVYSIAYTAEDPNGGFVQTNVRIRVIAPIDVREPNGGETFLLGNVVPVTWTSPGFRRAGVNIELSRDGGGTWEVLATNEPDDGQFSFIARAPVTKNALIRITSVEEPLDWGVSDRPFLITDGDARTLCITPTSIPIPDNDPAWTTSTLDIPFDTILRGVRVPVKITHPYIGDLEVELVHPDGTRVLLHDETGADTDNIDTVYGHGRGLTPPASPLDVLVGKRSIGTWKLRVRDLKPGSIGELTEWCVTAIGPPAGRIEVTAPNTGAERWHIGGTQTITWTADANVKGDVDIQVSRNGGATWEVIGTVPATRGRFDWRVTGPPTDGALIRISDALEPVVFDDSDRPFKIVEAFLRVLSPNGGEKLSTGRPFDIRWDNVPDTGTVTIEVSIDGGLTWRLIRADAPNTGTYRWIPEAGLDTDRGRIRIRANSAPARLDTSDEDFTIQTLAILLRSPVGGETWYTFTTQAITWDSVGVPGNVRIEVSRDGGSTWTGIGLVPASDQRFDWTVAAPASANAKIRVVSLDLEGLSGESGIFTIRGMAVTVLTPNGGEEWGIGTTRAIEWSTEGVPAGRTVNIYISRDGGQTFEAAPIVAGTANDGSADWTVTGPESENCVLKVQTADFPAFDVSDGRFKVLAPAINVSSPNGGEELRVGHRHTFVWQSKGVAGPVTIELSRDNGATWTTLFASTPNDGSEEWTVQKPEASQALLRVSAASGPPVSDTSDNPFRITIPTVTVLSPNGGEQWRVGSQQEISWTGRGIVGRVKVELTRSGGNSWEPIGTVEGATRLSWQVTGPGATNARVRVVPEQDPDGADESDGPFTILQPAITVGTPNGGQRWLIGTRQAITWASTGVTGDVKIEISRNGGRSWDPILESTPNDGTEAWKVAGPATDNALIRISSVSDASVSDTSNGTFRIDSPTIRVTAPGRGARWKIGTRQTITWTGSVVRTREGTVDIQLSRDGKTFTTIIADTANDGIVTWQVTGRATRSARIRVVWKPDRSVQDTSSRFAIVR